MGPLSMGREDSSDSPWSFEAGPLSKMLLPSVRSSIMHSSLFYCPLSLDWELLRDRTSPVFGSEKADKFDVGMTKE